MDCARSTKKKYMVLPFLDIYPWMPQLLQQPCLKGGVPIVMHLVFTILVYYIALTPQDSFISTEIVLG